MIRCFPNFLLLSIFSLVITPLFSQQIGVDDVSTVSLCPDSTVWTWGRAFQSNVLATSVTTPEQLFYDNGMPFTEAVKVAGGGASLFAIRKDSTLWGWGSNSAGKLGNNTTTIFPYPRQVLGPGGVGFLEDVIHVCTSYQSSFAVRADGTVWSWGWNGTGVLGDGTYFNSRSTPVQVIELGSAIALDSIVTVSSGPEHALALNQDGSVWAWGRDYSGAVGQGTAGPYFLGAQQVKAPSGIGFLQDIIAVAAGDNFSVGLRSDGTVWTWGSNEFGTLGDGTALNSALPVQVKDTTGLFFLSDIVAIDAGKDHVMALSSTGTVFVWGSNEFGQLSSSFSGRALNRPLAVKDMAPMAEIYAGGYASAVINPDNELQMWGINQYGNLGNDDQTLTIYTPRPAVSVDGKAKLNNVKQLSTGYTNQYALLNNGQVVKWGNNVSNELGSPLSYSSPLPVLDTFGTGPLTNIAQINASELHALYLDNNGVVYGSGNTNNAVLGNQPFSHSYYPFPLRYSNGAILNQVAKVDASAMQSAFLMQDSTVKWMGRFNGSTRYYPLAFKDSANTADLDNITDIASSINLMLALDADSTLWAWGTNTYGQIGDGTTSNRSLPVHVKDSSGTNFLDKVIAIDAEEYVALALRSDSTVWAWGHNDRGQHGIGNTSSSLLPRQVLDSAGIGPLKHIVAIAAGEFHCLAVAADSTAWAWGWNVRANLGDGTDTSTLRPVHVRDDNGNILRGVVGVQTGELLSGFLMADGSVRSCGYNLDGQTGTYSTLGQAEPVKPLQLCRFNAPMAFFSANQTSACEQLCVTFTDSSSFSPDTWLWTFEGGDTLSSSDQNPTVCYSTPGTYAVTLTVSNLVGQDSLVKESYITVYPAAVADAGPDQTVCEGDLVQLMASGGLLYSWSPAIGLSCSNCQDPVFLLNASTTYTVAITDTNGCTATDQVVVMADPLPQSNFTFSLDSTIFTILTSNSSSHATSYFWTFGDGTSDTTATPSHEYVTNGTFDICLISTNDCGSDTTCSQVEIMSVGITQASAPIFQVAPNPSNGQIRISLSDPWLGGTIEVVDLKGKVVKSLELSPGSSSAIEVEMTLPSGMYICRFLSERGSYSSIPLLIQR